MQRILNKGGGEVLSHFATRSCSCYAFFSIPSLKPIRFNLQRSHVYSVTISHCIALKYKWKERGRGGGGEDEEKVNGQLGFWQAYYIFKKSYQLYYTFTVT